MTIYYYRSPQYYRTRQSCSYEASNAIASERRTLAVVQYIAVLVGSTTRYLLGYLTTVHLLLTVRFYTDPPPPLEIFNEKLSINHSAPSLFTTTITSAAATENYHHHQRSKHCELTNNHISYAIISYAKRNGIIFIYDSAFRGS